MPKYVRDKKNAGALALLTVRQFSDRLGMSYEWARKKVQRRQIAFVRMGRSVRIPEAEVERFIAANLVRTEEL